MHFVYQPYKKWLLRFCQIGWVALCLQACAQADKLGQADKHGQAMSSDGSTPIDSAQNLSSTKEAQEKGEEIEKWQKIFFILCTEEVGLCNFLRALIDIMENRPEIQAYDKQPIKDIVNTIKKRFDEANQNRDVLIKAVQEKNGGKDTAAVCEKYIENKFNEFANLLQELETMLDKLDKSNEKKGDLKLDNLESLGKELDKIIEGSKISSYSELLNFYLICKNNLQEDLNAERLYINFLEVCDGYATKEGDLKELKYKFEYWSDTFINRLEKMKQDIIEYAGTEELIKHKTECRKLCRIWEKFIEKLKKYEIENRTSKVILCFSELSDYMQRCFATLRIFLDSDGCAYEDLKDIDKYIDRLTKMGFDKYVIELWELIIKMRGYQPKGG